MRPDKIWILLDGIDRVGSPVPDTMNIYAVCVMFKCYHAILNDYETILDGCIAQHDSSEMHRIPQ